MNPSSTATPLADAITDRVGVMPNFFRLASSAPSIAENIWRFAKFAYLDSPLPSLFKERLFVHFSRYCEVRYCLGRHFCFLVGNGRPSGDALTPPMSTERAIALLKQTFGPQNDMDRHMSILRTLVGPLRGDIQPDSEVETALMAVCTAIFLNPQKTQAHLPTLRRIMGGEQYEYLLLFIGFVRMAHFWTQVHPDLEEEEDLIEMMKVLEELSWGLAWNSHAGWSVAMQVADELEGLKRHKDGRGKNLAQ